MDCCRVCSAKVTLILLTGIGSSIKQSTITTTKQQTGTDYAEI
jgi:hypothetical protein